MRMIRNFSGSAKLKQRVNDAPALARLNHQQGGYTLIAIIVFLMIVGAMATGGVGLSVKSEQLAGNAIQRSRSFVASEGAATLAEKQIIDMMQRRLFADAAATDGIFSRGNRSAQWWRQEVADGVQNTDPASVLGVISQPRYVIEQVGDYVADGGTGVVNLDIGGGAYGRLTAGGRELLLFNVESNGKGSFDSVDTVVETTIAFSY